MAIYALDGGNFRVARDSGIVRQHVRADTTAIADFASLGWRVERVPRVLSEALKA
jgi:hypothetical protein